MKFNIKILWAMILVLSCGILANMLLENHLANIAKKNKRYFNQGVTFSQNKDFQNAYYNFAAVEKGSEYYCPSIYNAALTAKKLYDKTSAIKMYNDILENCTDTIFEENSKYNLAKFYIEKENFKKAKNIFEELNKNAKHEPYKIASNYFLAELETSSTPTNTQQAKTYYIEYLKKAPDGKYATASINGLLKLKCPLNAEEKRILAVALYNDGDCDSAKRLFYELPLEQSWYYLAMCERKTGNYKQTKELLDKGLGTYSDAVTEPELQEAIDIYALYAPTRQSGYLNATDKLTPNKLKGGDYALYKYILESPRKTREPHYKKIFELYPDGNFASDALWNLIYRQYKQKNYTNVIKMAAEHQQKYPNTIAAPRVMFFSAKSAEKQGLYANEKNTLKKLITKYPDSYYAHRANQLLHNRKTAWIIKNKKQINNPNTDISFPINYCKLNPKDTETVNLIAASNDIELIEDLLGENLIVKSWINFKKGNKALSSVQARSFISQLSVKPAFSDDIYKLAYPMYYTDEINQYAQAYNLDPYLILSIIKEESHFEPNAKSYVGASGLMQLMPDTASFIAQKYEIPYTSSNLNTISTNINLGCAYLDYALNELQKKYLFAIAGYNGGHNAVKNWHNTLNYTDYDEFVEEIPYEETQSYIRKVFKSYWNYLNIYDTIE